MKSLSILSILILCVISSSIGYSVEKDRLMAFLTEFKGSDEGSRWGRVAFAVERGYPDVAEHLVAKGEPITQYRIEYALKVDPKILGLNDHVRNTLVKHPLITAIEKNYVSLATLMIQMGQAERAEEYRTEWSYAASKVEVGRKNAMYAAVVNDRIEIVVGLLGTGFDVNCAKALIPTPDASKLRLTDCSRYSTPLLLAIANRNVKMAILLLDSGADTEVISCYPCLDLGASGACTALQCAVADSFLEGVDLLLSYGANPLTHPLGGSPLEMAMKIGNQQIIDLLLDAAVKG